MPRRITPFDFTNVIHLLEYLATHSMQPSAYAAFSVKLTLETNDDDEHNPFLDQLADSLSVEVESVTTRCKVEGVAGVAAVFQRSPYTVEKIEWRAHGNDVRIDCLNREIYMATDSMAFTEICRHKMTGQAVRKFTVDLKIQ